MTGVCLDSLCIPLNAKRTISLLLADDSISDLPEGEELAILPSGWRAVVGTERSTITFEPAADDRGLNNLQIRELREYYWRIQFSSADEDPSRLIVSSSLEGSSSHAGWKPKRSKDLLCGTFQFINYLGSAWIAVRDRQIGSDLHKLRFDVVTTQLDYEFEYRAMVEAIASECQQLLLEWGSPTTLHITTDPERLAQTLLEQFLFLRHVLGSEKLQLYLETLRRHPHTRLVAERQWEPAAIACPTLFIQDPLRFGRDWIVAETNKRVFPPIYALEIIEERRFDSLDTAPNRFVKFALENFRSLCDQVMAATIRGKSLAEEQGTAWREAKSMRNALDAFLISPFFSEVGEVQQIPFDSQALQKREGYLEILQAWLLLDAAAQIDWPGRNDAYDGTNRDVATLYEFWLFFVLARAFQHELGMSIERDSFEAVDNALPFCCRADDGRMVVNLKQGAASFCRFTWQKEGARLRLHFFYNRRFDRRPLTIRGTYSKEFRPDYSLVIIPDEFEDENWLAAERNAESQGRIAYLHFDAKYRVETLTDVFGGQEVETVENSARSKATGTFKSADLYKMHTYNDAIRRTVGSYVLYPGDDPKNETGISRFERYNEIVPGIGAFALKPKTGDGMRPEGLSFLVEFISDLLDHQLSKFTQNYRISYWTERTLRESAPDYEPRILDFAVDPIPPKDTQVLLGFIRSEQEAKSCYETETFFCHAVEWNVAGARNADGSGVPGEPSNLDFDPFRAELLVVYHQNETANWIAKVEDVRLVSAEERSIETNRPLAEMHAAYYYRFQLTHFQSIERRNLASIVPRRPGQPICCLLSEFAACPKIAA